MEHRQGCRHPTDCPASLSSVKGKRLVPCRIRNISQDGMYLEYRLGTRQPIQEYDFVKVNPARNLMGAPFLFGASLEGIVCHASEGGAGVMLKEPLAGASTMAGERLETAA